MITETNQFGWIFTLDEEKLRKIIAGTVQELLEQRDALARPEKLYTTEEAANLLNISKITLHRWKDAGRIAPVQVKGSRKLLYAESEIKRVLNGI